MLVHGYAPNVTKDDQIVLNFGKLRQLVSPYRYDGTLTMTLSQWAAVTDNPIQRNTAEREKRASHLKGFDEAHRKVTMAVLPDGRMFKIDGHTRCAVWQSGACTNLPDPMTVIADVYQCRDIEAVKDLYRKFDSKVAVETASDQLSGISRDLRMNFVSPVLKSGKYGSAVKSLYSRIHGFSRSWSDARFVYEAINYFKPELHLLDKTEPKHMTFPSSYIMAALLTFMRYEDDASEFWRQYFAGEGFQNGQMKDGVVAIRNLHADYKARGLFTRSFEMEIIGRVINAYEMHRTGGLYKDAIPKKKDENQLKAWIAAAVKRKADAQ